MATRNLQPHKPLSLFDEVGLISVGQASLESATNVSREMSQSRASVSAPRSAGIQSAFSVSTMRQISINGHGYDIILSSL
jgi:hypothetical protein